MAAKPTLSPKHLPQPPPPAPAQETNVQQEMRIDRTARALITLPAAVRAQARTTLLRERAALLTHVPFNGITTPTVLFLNMTQIGQPPTPHCPYYNKMRIPTVSTYHTISSNFACIRLDLTALEHIPRPVLQMAGDLNGKQIDLFWTAIDARAVYNDFVEARAKGQNRSFNLTTHPWVHERALMGDDVKRDILMGIFPETGFGPYRGRGAIAINALSPMEVYTHIDRYSPDNAHFEPIPGSPFGVLWAVAQKDNQVAITKMLTLFDYDHPISRSLVATTRDCPNLDTHLQLLDDVRQTIDETFRPLIVAFEGNAPGALKMCAGLPPSFQEGVLKELQELKGQPIKTMGQCSNPECAAAILLFSIKLQQLLVDSQRDLLLDSQPLVRGDNVLKMMQCAQLFSENRTREGYQQFETFTHNEKVAVWVALWEISKCPRGNFRFGEETFSSEGTPNHMKKQAILLAASRQAPEFVQPVVTPPPAPPVVANTPAEMREATLKMLFEEEYALANKDRQKELVMQQLNRLELPMRNQIFGEVYNLSTDPQKGGDSWGEIHVADDTGVLAEALMAVIRDDAGETVTVHADAGTTVAVHT